MAFGGLLSGCSLQPGNGDRAAEETAAPAGEIPLGQIPAETAAEETATAPMTDAELDQEVKAIDAELETVKITGFEAANLADKDLGL